MQTDTKKSGGAIPPSKAATGMAPDIASALVPDTLAALHVNPETGLTHAEVDNRRKAQTHRTQEVYRPAWLRSGVDPELEGRQLKLKKPAVPSLKRFREVTEEVLRTVFGQLYTQRVMLEGIILKPNMVLPTKGALAQLALYHRARCNSAARLGQYRIEMENNVDSRAICAEVVTSIGSDLVRFK